MKKPAGRPRRFSDAERKQRKKACEVRWRKNNLTKVREDQRLTQIKWRANNPEKLKKIRRASHFKNTYGLTIEQRDEMIVAQDGKCAVCKASAPNHFKGWFVDHAHTSNKVRGILCHGCNSGIGLLKDSPEICLAAAAYLLKNA